MKYLFTSNPLTLNKENASLASKIGDKLVLVAQYYVDPNPDRAKEIEYCLHRNVDIFDEIVLLNEREYSAEEMGFKSTPSNITQSIIGKRMRYEHAFQYARTACQRPPDLCDRTCQRPPSLAVGTCKSLTEGGVTFGDAYIVIANSDIFFDDTLYNLRLSDLAESKKCMAQLRIEFSPDKSSERSGEATFGKQPHIFGPRYDAQDAWIFHTNHLPTFPINVGLGIPGCDNKLAYLLACNGFELINHPDVVRVFHYHTTQLRRYTAADRLPEPYACIMPYGVHVTMDSLGIISAYKDEMSFNDNTVLYDYLTQKLSTGERFAVPRISTVETNEAYYYTRLYIDKPQPTEEDAKTGRKDPVVFDIQMNAYLNGKQHIDILKTNAGIWFNKEKSRYTYAKQYMAAFENCDLFGGWEKWSNMYPKCGAAQEYILGKYNKRVISSSVFDIFHYVHHEHPWTLALRGKRVLIISAFAQTMEKQIEHREKIYGRDLFPDCTFLFLVPPQTQADEPAQDFVKVTKAYYAQIDALIGKFDVALVSCGGYGAPTVQHIYEKGGSAIYVGGVLQMYFGILGARWLKERPDMVRAYLNSAWKRPDASQKPKGCDKVEGGCYW